MDIFSHGLYGSIAFGRRNRRSFWLAFFFGVAPDLFSFGIFFVQRIFNLGNNEIHGFTSGPPDPSAIPSYVSSFYNITHSLVIFSLVFLVVWLIQRKPVLELLAWPLHVLVDIPTHSAEFFPTPFLWPISEFHVNGVSWGHPYIFFPNVIFLAVIYIWYFYFRKKEVKEAEE